MDNTYLKINLVWFILVLKQNKNVHEGLDGFKQNIKNNGQKEIKQRKWKKKT